MDRSRFDELARTLSVGAYRRTELRTLLVGADGGAGVARRYRGRCLPAGASHKLKEDAMNHGRRNDVTGSAGTASRRRVVTGLAGAITVGLLGPVALGRTGPAAAQDATPSSADAPPLQGVAFEILGSGEPTAAPGQTLAFVRMTIEPGGFIGARGHPGAQIWYVEDGSFTTTMLEGALRITHAAEGGTPAPSEPLAAGDEATLAAGDAAFFDADVVHTVRHAGDGPTVVLIPALFATGQEPLIFHAHDQGTPAS